MVGGSPWYKLFIVFIIVIASTVLTMLLGTLMIPLLFDIPFMELTTLLEDPNYYGRVEILKFLQGLSTLGTFMIPGLLGAYLISPYPSDYLNINSFPRRAGLVVILLLALTLSGTVISDTLFRLSNAISFPESWSDLESYLDTMQKATQDQMLSFLDMNSPLEFIQMIIIMAVLPAVCEETLFRGVLQPLFIKGFKNVHIGIIITSLLFGMLHQQIYSFLSITALSVILGYLKLWSRSLWVPVVMHFFNNASIIIAIYFFEVPIDSLDDVSADWDFTYIFGGLGVFILALYGLRKMIYERLPL